MDDRPPQESKSSGNRSLFWPFLLIGLGIVWLLGNLGLLSLSGLWTMARYWPVLLIAAGIDLLLGRRNRWISALIGILVVGLAVWYLASAPGLDIGVVGGPESRTTHVSEPVGKATSAQVRLDLAEAPTTVRALEDSADLIDATFEYRGEIDFRVSGEDDKVVILGPVHPSGLPLIGLGLWGEGNWAIGLSPNLPLDMEIECGTGRADLDMASLQVSRFRLDVSSGSVRAILPAMEERYRVQVGGGSGSLDLVLPGDSQIDLDLNVHSGSVDMTVGVGASLNAHIDGGSGSLRIDVPDGVALRFTVRDGGSGSVTLPDDLRQVSDGNDRDDETGTWETPGFSDAGTAIIVSVDLGSGSVSVR